MPARTVFPEAPSSIAYESYRVRSRHSGVGPDARTKRSRAQRSSIFASSTHGDSARELEIIQVNTTLTDLVHRVCQIFRKCLVRRQLSNGQLSAGKHIFQALISGQE